MLITYLFSGLRAQVFINEFMASNATTIADEDGDYEDWIELYNSGDSIVNLKGFWLSDKASEPDLWVFPEVFIAPGDFLLVFASGKDRHSGPYLHTNFKISIDGEPLLLSDSTGQLIDYIAPVTLTTDNAYGRLPDGGGQFVFFDGSTPGYSNNNNPILEPYTDTLFFLHNQGFYTAPFKLSVNNLDNQAVIRYTTNGSIPDSTAAIFPDSLLIYNRESDDNIISTIRTNPETTPSYYRWKEPGDNIFKGTVLRLRSFINGEPASRTYTKTYWVHPNIYQRYNMPVISIVTDSLHLFDYEWGIYVPGLHHDLNPVWHWDWGTGNYHQRGFEWERPASITFFEANGSLAFHQDVGIRIHGDGSRALPQKSLRIYARNLYGNNTIDYRFFPEESTDSFRRILLRNSGQDFYRTMLTDALTSRIVEPMNLEAQSARSSVVFINSEFWGIHNIRDRIDKYFFEYCCGANPEEIDYLEFNGDIIEGANTDYKNLLNFIENNSLEVSNNYNYVAQQIDIVNYIDYIIAKQFIAVYDWPGNNVEFWRKSNPPTKWRWVFYDNDMSLEHYTFDAIEHSTAEGNTSWPNPDWSTFLLRNLYKNEDFVNLYLARFEYHLYNTFTETRINAHLDSLLYFIEPVMEEQIDRWGKPYSHNYWESTIEAIRQFATMRPCYMKQHLIAHFNITDSTYAEHINCDTPTIDDDLGIFNIYPNPVNDVINIDFVNEKRTAICKLFDITGRLIAQTYAENVKEVKMPVYGFCSGTYILKINIDGQRFFEKIVLY